MPVQIQCTSVVIRNDAMDRVFDDGSSGFDAIAPNAMSYADDCLSQASFMSPVDAQEFAKSLELRGMDRNADSPDFVVVQAHDQSIEPPCDWLILFEYEQRLIATMRGNDSRTVIASAIDGEYNPNAVRHYLAEDIERLFEFVERKDNIDTYRHKETGELVCHTRKTETADEVFSRVFETVWQLRREPGTAARTGDEATALSQPIADLQSLVAKHPDVAKPSLALGMAWFAIGKRRFLLYVAIFLGVLSCGCRPDDRSYNPAKTSQPEAENRTDMFGTPLTRAIRRGLKPDADLVSEIRGVGDYSIKSRKDALAIVEALQSLTPGTQTKAIGTSPVHCPTGLFQDVESTEVPAFAIMASDGIDELVRLYDNLLVEDAEENANDLMFILKIFAMYGSQPGCDRIVQAARRPLSPDGYMWSMIRQTCTGDHPHRSKVIHELSDPIPDGFIGICLLDASTPSRSKANSPIILSTSLTVSAGFAVGSRIATQNTSVTRTAPRPRCHF